MCRLKISPYCFSVFIPVSSIPFITFLLQSLSLSISLIMLGSSCSLHLPPFTPLLSSSLLSYLDCKDTRCSSTNEYLLAPLPQTHICPQHSSSPYALSPSVTSQSARSPDTAADPQPSRMARRRRSSGQQLLGGESNASSPRSLQ